MHACMQLQGDGHGIGHGYATTTIISLSHTPGLALIWLLSVSCHLHPTTQLASDILKGLQYLHSWDVMHRDLKPVRGSCLVKHLWL